MSTVASILASIAGIITVFYGVLRMVRRYVVDTQVAKEEQNTKDTGRP